MRKSAKRPRFIVPFATNVQTNEEKRSAIHPIASEIKLPEVKSTCSYEGKAHIPSKQPTSVAHCAEEILKLITDDSDDDDDHSVQQTDECCVTEQSHLPISTSRNQKKHSLLPLRKKFPDIVQEEQKITAADDDNINADATCLSADEIYNMNCSKKELKLSDVAKYYSVLWCKRSTKKHKNWEGDAVLIIEGRSAVLKDMDGKRIASGIGYKVKEVTDLEDGSKFFIGGKECEIQQEIKQEDFLSGKCFQSENRSALSPAAITLSCKKFYSPLNALIPKNKKSKFQSLQTKDPSALYMPEPNSFQNQWHLKYHQQSIVDVKVDSRLSQHLRPHQREGVIFMYECILGFRNFQGQGAILGDEMGLGKTLQCITLIWTLCKQGPYEGKPVLKKVLIITPSSLVKNWEAEFFKWLGKNMIAVFAVGPKRKVTDFVHSNYTVLIISYEMYIRSAEVLSSVNFDLVICDEGHRLKNVNIKTSEVIMCIPTKRRILLTGTPIQNDLEEFYSIVEFVNPGILGSISSFRKLYQDPILKSHNPNCTEEEKCLGKTRATELFERTKLFFLRRTQDVINKYLPPKFESVVFCRPTDIQCTLYEHLLQSKDLQRCLLMEGLSGSCVHLQFISALRKLCNHPSLLYSSPQTPQLEDTDLCDNSILEYVHSAFPKDYEPCPEHSGKMKVLDTLLSTLFAMKLKEKVVIVSNFTQTLNIIEDLCKKNCYSYLRLDGSTSSSTRLDLVEKFNNHFSKFFIFLLSSKAGGVGLNLIGASRIVLYDIDWNPATDLQAMARVWRDGQKKAVYVYRLLTAGTIEEKMYQRQVAKQGLSGTVIDSTSTFKSQFSYEELKDIFTFHSNVQCVIHDSIQCDCLHRQIKEHSDKENTRPCQLGYLKAVSERKNTSMAELLKWNHTPSPITNIDIPKSCLEACSKDITFLFTNNVNLTVEKKD